MIQYIEKKIQIQNVSFIQKWKIGQETASKALS